MTALLCIACLSPAHAGPPGVTEDPGTPEYRFYEVNINYGSTQVVGSEAEQTCIEVNYGYVPNVEVTASADLQSSRNTGSVRSTGFGDVGLGAKWCFQNEGPSRLPLAVLYAVNVPTASAERGLGTGDFDQTVLLSTEKDSGKESLWGNIGYNVLGEPGSRNNALWGVASLYQTSEAWSVGGELYGNGSQAPGQPSEFAYNLIAIDQVSPDKALMVAVGQSMHGLADLTIWAGIQLILAPPQKPTAPASAPAAGAGDAPVPAIAPKG